MTHRTGAGRGATIGLWIVAGVLLVLVGISLLAGGKVAVLGASVAGTAAAAAIVTALTPRVGVPLTGLLSALSAAYLFSRKLADASGDSLCTANAVINCDTVNSSSASEIFGIPVSLFGVAFYLGVFAASLGGPRRMPRFHQVLALFSVFTIAYSVLLSGVMVTLGAVCVFCAAMYAGNIILALSAWRGLSTEGRRMVDDLGGLLQARSLVTVSTVFGVVLLMGGTTWILHSSGLPEGVLTPEEVQELYALPDGPVTWSEDDPVLGRPDAPYVVVEFADYQCPHCADAALDLPLLVEANPDIQVRFRPFPLSGKCNPLIPEDHGTLDRCRAAWATECARQQGRFWEMSHLVFKNPGYFAEDELAYMAEQVGLDVAAFRACLTSDATRQAVLDDATAGHEAGVTGTPTMFLRVPGSDGWLRTARGVHPVPAIDAIVRTHAAGVALPPAQAEPPR